MKKFAISRKKKIEEWEIFYDNLKEAKEKLGMSQFIYKIDLFPPDVIVPFGFHMIVSKNKNLKTIERIFSSYDKARKVYEKEKLNICLAEILPIWKIFKIDKKNNSKEKLYEVLL